MNFPKKRAISLPTHFLQHISAASLVLVKAQKCFLLSRGSIRLRFSREAPQSDWLLNSPIHLTWRIVKLSTWRRTRPTNWNISCGDSWEMAFELSVISARSCLIRHKSVIFVYGVASTLRTFGFVDFLAHKIRFCQTLLSLQIIKMSLWLDRITESNSPLSIRSYSNQKRSCYLMIKWNSEAWMRSRE